MPHKRHIQSVRFRLNGLEHIGRNAAHFDKIGPCLFLQPDNIGGNPGRRRVDRCQNIARHGEERRPVCRIVKSAGMPFF
ncbi:hypothetical protein D3C73_1530020 [compost metagenome]